MRVNTAVLLAVISGLAVACVPDVKSGPTPTTSAATIATFSPNTDEPCLSVMPYPVDLVKNPVTGKLDIPYCPGDSQDQIDIKTGLRTLDGWAVGTPIYTDFSDVIDVATLANAVKLLDLSHNAEIPVATQFDDVAKRLYIAPTVSLKEKTRYAVIITDELTDAGGKPVVSDQVFNFVKSTTPLVDASGYSTSAALTDAQAYALEPLRKLYDELFSSVILPAGLTREETIVAWTFTTQTVQTELTSLATVVDGHSFGTVTLHEASPAATNALLAAAGLPTSDLCRIYDGRVMLVDLLDAGGELAPEFATTAALEPMDYLVVTPKPPQDATGCACDTGRGTCQAACSCDPDCVCTDMTQADPWDFSKVALFVHGLSRCKSDVLALAGTLAAKSLTIPLGYAVLAIDGPRAGSRTIGNLGDLDMDGCPDQPATPELITLGTANPNPFAVRDRIWEWGMETMQLAKTAHLAPWEFIGATEPTTTPSTSVAAIGHSWGGMAAVIAGAVSPDIDLLAVNATSADLQAMFAPLLAQGLAAQLTAAGVDITTGAGKLEYEATLNQTVSTFGWALEPADPRFAALLYPTRAHALPVLAQVVTSGNLALMPDAPLHATATQDELVAAFPALHVADVTFKLACDQGGVVTPICDSSQGVVGAMLQPCVADTASPLFALAYDKVGAIRTQLATFLASGGALIPATDSVSACP